MNFALHALKFSRFKSEREALLGDPATLPAGVDRRGTLSGEPTTLDFLEEESSATAASSSISRNLASAASLLALAKSRFANNLAW